MHTAAQFLDAFNRKFLPIRIPQPNERLTIEAHTRELCDSFKLLDEEHKGQHPIAAIAPIFYVFTDWRHDDRYHERAGEILWFSNVPDMADRIIAQGLWASDRDRRTTEENVRAVNNSDVIDRLVLVITDEDSNPFKEEQIQQLRTTGDDVLLFPVSSMTRCTYRTYDGDNEELRRLIGLVDELPLGKGDVGVLDQARYQAFKELGREHELKRPENLPTMEVKLVARGNEARAITELGTIAARITPWIEDHSVFIDARHTLFYIFSNIVHVNHRQKGCGGLFLVVRNEALATMDWFDSAKRIADKIANRIVHQVQLDEVERHALNSAITQTAARNYAHHIGAHIKMRCTPQEIKKRIKDLHPTLDIEL